MKKLPGPLIVSLVIGLLLATSMPGFAEGTGTILQDGSSNVAFIYQELLSEVIVLQRGDENSSLIEQLGAEHLAGVAQIGEKNRIRIHQRGQRDHVVSMQFGYRNSVVLAQVHALVGGPARANITDNDAFVYQSGLYNDLHGLQIGDGNTMSIYQVENNNEVFIIQEELALGTGVNAAMVLQAGINNWNATQQIGAGQVAKTLQIGNDNSTLIAQSGFDNQAWVIQHGNHNNVKIKQI